MYKGFIIWAGCLVVLNNDPEYLESGNDLQKCVMKG